MKLQKVGQLLLASMGWLAGALNANATPITPMYFDVLPGEVLSLEFRFDTPAVNFGGSADTFLTNGGSTSIGNLGSDVKLFVDNQLQGTYISPYSNAFSLFRDPSSTYTVLGGAVVDLSELFFAGAIGRIEFTPIFDASPGAYINYQFTTFEAARSVSGASHVNNYALPTILSATVSQPPSPAPEPAMLALMSLGLFGLGAMRHKKR